MKRLEAGYLPDSVKKWPRPNNIPGDGLQGILQPRTVRSTEEAETDGHSARAWHGVDEDEGHDWDDLVYVNPRATFASTEDEEPWYWGVLDEDPFGYCPCEDDEVAPNTGTQEQEAGRLFEHGREDKPTWAPGDIDIPTDYIPRSCGRSWRDSALGPILRLEPTHPSWVMGDDDNIDDMDEVAPPTPITGHTPPATPTGEEEPATTPGRAEEMTLTQAHRWWEHGDEPTQDPVLLLGETTTADGVDGPKESGADRDAHGDTRRPDIVSWTQAHDLIYGNEQDEGTDPGLATVYDELGIAQDGTGTTAQAHSHWERTEVKLTPRQSAEHEHFVRSVIFYEPEEQQDVILGIGEDTPKKAVDHRSGKIVEGSQTERLAARNRQVKEWANREGSRTNIGTDTIMEEDERIINELRAQEAPLPTITDRWGNQIPVVGYGTGTYYRLSRQPMWLIRQVIAEDTIAHDPKRDGKAKDRGGP